MKGIRRWNTGLGVLCLSIALVLPIQGVGATGPEEKSGRVVTETADGETALPGEDTHMGTGKEVSPKNAGAEENEQEGNTETNASSSIDQSDNSGQPEEAKAPSESEPEKDCIGWVHRESGWYYYAIQGQRYTGWLFDGNTWYYLDGQDAEHPGLMAASKELSVEGSFYCFDGNGAMLTGWVHDGTDWYYYNPSGDRANGWVLQMK